VRDYETEYVAEATAFQTLVRDVTGVAMDVSNVPA